MGNTARKFTGYFFMCYNLPIMIRAFTIIEIVIVVAVISVVSLVSAPLGIQFFYSQTLVGAQSQLGDALTRARSQSIVQKNDAQYGVCLIPTGDESGSIASYTLYQGAAGTDCASHTAGVDEPYPALDGMIITFPGSATEINFAKHSGLPSATGTISLTWNGLTKTLTIDSQGTIVEN